MTTCRLLAAVALVLASAALAAAGEPTERLRTFFERANAVIVAPESEGGLHGRVGAVRALVTEVFDFDGAAALALGRRWEMLSPSARATFTRLYADLVERAYLGWVGSKARVGEGGVSVRWVEEIVEGDAATVRSVLLTRAGGELPIDYRLVRRARRWLVRDVVVDGVSLAANYHVQFERVVQLGSYDELLVRLRDKAGRAARDEAEAEIRDTGDVVATDAWDVVVSADARLTALVPPASGPPTDRTPPRATSSVHPTPSSAASTAAPPTAGVEAPPTPRQFWVQVGAFRTIDAAAQLVRRLQDHAITIAIGGERPAPLTRVLVGPFAERAAAAAAVRTLHASGLAAFIAE